MATENLAMEKRILKNSDNGKNGIEKKYTEKQCQRKKNGSAKIEYLNNW